MLAQSVCGIKGRLNAFLTLGTVFRDAKLLYAGTLLSFKTDFFLLLDTKWHQAVQMGVNLLKV